MNSKLKIQNSKLQKLLLLCAGAIFIAGCRTTDPHLTGYMTPAHLVNQIAPADHIVVVSSFRGIKGGPKSESFTMSISGHEVKTIIHAISSLRQSTYDVPSPGAGNCIFEWQLQFYRGTVLLGSADLGECLIRCDDVEYEQPRAIKRLYQRIAKESGQEG